MKLKNAMLQYDLIGDPALGGPRRTIHNPISLPPLLIASFHKQCMSQRNTHRLSNSRWGKFNSFVIGRPPSLLACQNRHAGNSEEWICAD